MTEPTAADIDTVLYHRMCRDGGTAAWCLHRFGGLTDAEYKDVAYYEDPPWDLIDDRNVLIVDFSYKRPVLLEIAERASSVQVLDHHKTAKDELDGLDFCVFDMDKSGAMLAWDWCLEHRRESVNAALKEESVPGEFSVVMVDGAPWPIAYAQDYDLWRHELPDTEAVSAVFKYQKFDDFEALDRLYERGLAACIELGDIFSEAIRWECQDIVNHAKVVDGHGVSIGVTNCSARHWSTALHMLLEQKPELEFAVAFIGGGKSWTHTLRSRSEDDVDVSRIASVFGGGGHKNAAGFKSRYTPIPAESIINAYLYTKDKS